MKLSLICFLLFFQIEIQAFCKPKKIKISVPDSVIKNLPKPNHLSITYYTNNNLQANIQSIRDNITKLPINPNGIVFFNINGIGKPFLLTRKNIITQIKDDYYINNKSNYFNAIIDSLIKIYQVSFFKNSQFICKEINNMADFLEYENALKKILDSNILIYKSTIDFFVSKKRMKPNLLKILNDYIKHLNIAPLDVFYSKNGKLLHLNKQFGIKFDTIISIYNNFQNEESYKICGLSGLQQIPFKLKNPGKEFYNPNRINEKNIDSILQIIDNKFKGLAANYLASSVIKIALDNKTNVPQKNWEQYKIINSNKYFFREIENLNEANKEDILQSVFFNAKSKKNTTINDILKANENKVLLLDIWASWCKPCRELMPNANLLERSINSKNFKIITLSIDKNKSAWQNALVSEKNYLKKETAYWINDQINNEFLKSIKITTIPRYILINKKGEIANINAPIFNDIVLKSEIEKLLEDL
jgi:thiol-disulfide isomerase/thioredoxin